MQREIEHIGVKITKCSNAYDLLTFAAFHLYDIAFDFGYETTYSMNCRNQS